MKNDVLNDILYSRFDIPNNWNLDLSHKKLYGDNKIQSAVQYFQNKVNKNVDDIEARKPVFLSSLFHSILGFMILKYELNERERSVILNYVRSLCTEEGCFLPIDPYYIRQFPNVTRSKNNPLVPEIYSTYYGFFTGHLLNSDFDQETINTLTYWLISNIQPSGLIYNSQYSNTMESRRMESEVTSQLFLALSLLRILDIAQIKKIGNKPTKWLMAHLYSLKTVTSLYFGLKSLEILLHPSVVEIKQELLDFLTTRKSSSCNGYYDYLLTDKIDENMGSISLVSLDKISSHIFSTYYAISIVIKAIMSGNKSTKIDYQVIKNLEKSAHNSDGGYGNSVWIKDFGYPFGSASTELETIMIMLFPSLVDLNLRSFEE